MTETIAPIDAINEFYRLKDKYESDYNEKYVTPIVRSDRSKREKRVEFSRLPKPECINCKRKVKTIFSIKTNEDVRNFMVKCGDIADPCPLDIQINYSFRDNLYHTMVDGMKSIEDLKMAIIKEKNNALFFKKDVVEAFEKITADLKLKTESVGFAVETTLLRNNNPEKYALINKNIDEFGKGFLLPFKQMISTYMDNKDELVLNEAVNFYVNEMVPKLTEIQKMKYSVNYVDYNPVNCIYSLIQYPNSLESGEFYVKTDDKVVKFIKGIKKNKTMKNKTSILATATTGKPKTKTKKIRPRVELVIEEDVEDNNALGQNALGQNALEVSVE